MLAELATAGRSERTKGVIIERTRDFPLAASGRGSRYANSQVGMRASGCSLEARSYPKRVASVRENAPTRETASA